MELTERRRKKARENVKNDADIFSVFCDAFLANYEGGLNEISPI